jgi:hypothetical protein
MQKAPNFAFCSGMWRIILWTMFVNTADIAGRLMSKISSWHSDQLPDVVTLNEDIEFDETTR